MKKFGRFFGQCPKNNNDIRLRRVEVPRSESAVVPVFPKEEREEKTGFACCLFVKIITRLFPDMRRHSDTLRGAQRRRKRGSRGENGLSVSDYPLSSRHTLKISSFPGHAPGKDTLRAANAATKEGAGGGENGLSEAITRCRPRHRSSLSITSVTGPSWSAEMCI